MDHTNRFDGRGKIYAKARPRYAPELLDYMKNVLKIPVGSIFADIGSGTGIFTGQLSEAGYRVFAVEPNWDMRRIAEEKLSHDKNFVSVNGSEANMNLPDNSVDAITVAQAFHWFDEEAFRKECRRVLKPEGKVIIVYNIKDEKSDCTKALSDLRYKYNQEFHGFSNGISDEKCIAFFSGKCNLFRADNKQTYDRQGYRNLVLSSSYSLQEEDDEYAQYLEEINRIFDRYAVDDILTIPTETVAYIGTV